MATRKTPAKRRGKTTTAKSRVKKTVARKRGKAKATVVEIGAFLRNRRNTPKKKPMSAAAAIKQRKALSELGKQIEKTKAMLEKFRRGIL